MNFAVAKRTWHTDLTLEHDDPMVIGALNGKGKGKGKGKGIDARRSWRIQRRRKFRPGGEIELFDPISQTRGKKILTRLLALVEYDLQLGGVRGP